ncbi:MAG: sulfite oxidase-like oxidoreductase [Aquificae bacterium]|nr:sulfite oxidase-like oxidoreductase [Aquificota bacterium]
MAKKRIISPTVVRRLEEGPPPGQKFIPAPIVYDVVEEVPDWDLSAYRFKVWGLVERPLELTYEELLSSFEPVELVADFHCVTRWSVPELVWEGIQTRKVMERVKPKVKEGWVLVHCLEGYTTSLPLRYLFEEDSLLAYKMMGRPLPKRHGFPLRLVVPQLYAWKSAKYVWGLEILDHYEDGFWERRGYHPVGDPWKEERFK